MNFGLRLFYFLILLSLVFKTTSAPAIDVTGQLDGSGDLSGRTVLLVAKSGQVKAATTNSVGKFSLRGSSAAFLRNATVHLVNADGSYFGPVVLSQKGAKAFLNFSGKNPPGKRKISLKKIELKESFASVKKLPDSAIVNRKVKTDVDESKAPIGAGRSGLVTAQVASLSILDEEPSEAGEDDDHDGLINAFDVDDDGDLLLDATDSDSSASSARQNPWTSLFLPLNETLNLNAGDVTSEQIEATIASKLTLVLFYEVETGVTATSAHVICPSSLVYCRSAADGGTTSTVSGVSESTSPPSGKWSDYNEDGSGFPNLDQIERDGRDIFVASVSPSVGPTEFRPGDVMRIEFQNGSDQADSKTVSVAPYFVTVPAISSYDAGSGDTAMDYSNPTGENSSDPIVISGSGALTLSFWRPQRLAISGAESGDYRDIGGLHYGLIIGTDSQEFGCTGQYSNLSDTLSEDLNDEANLWPLLDSATDVAPDATNKLSFTVNLAQCLSENSVSAGTYRLNLTAAGEQLAGGANRAVQEFYVQVP